MASSQWCHEYGRTLVSPNGCNEERSCSPSNGMGKICASRNDEINSFRHDLHGPYQSPYPLSSSSLNGRSHMHEELQCLRPSMLWNSAGGPYDMNAASHYAHGSPNHTGSRNHILYERTDNSQNRPKVYVDLINGLNEIPGAIESETSSVDISFEDDDEIRSAYKSRKKNNNYQNAPPINPFKHYSYDFENGYGNQNINRCEPTYASSTGRNVVALAAYEMTLKNKRYNDAGSAKCKMIEIAPGEYMKLRGAEETWKAIQNDFYLPCSCVCCNLTLFCIQDATYVLCPVCQVISPLDKLDGFNGGVGLGFTMEELAEWQNDIVMNRGL